MPRHASLNRIYRLVWSSLYNAWIAVAENVRGRGKTGRLKLASAAFLLCAAQAQAAPAGGQVVGGSGSISQSGNTTTIQQNSQNLSVNWQSFNVGRQETVNFVQPSAAAIAVNRIYDTAGSQILGKLNANGQVWLINPNGVLFGQGAQVNVGGLVASTLDLASASGDGKTARFSGSGSGSVINQGSLNASTGGYVALLGKSVANSGTISAPQGTVALGAGSALTLNFNGNRLASLRVEQSLVDTLAANGGLIQANGGQVLLSAGARDSVIASVVNNSGVIEARTVENQSGTIVLLAGMAAGTTQVGGTLDASAPNGGNGGFIETSGARVKVADDAKITTLAADGRTGTWLIDPSDFTVAASGGDMTGAMVGLWLKTNSIKLSSDSAAGNVNINDSVSWSANTLTLNAANNININAVLDASGTAGLALEYGQGALAAGNTGTYNVRAPVNLGANGSFSTKLGSNGTVRNYTIVTDVYALQNIHDKLSGKYVLGKNIDASVTAGWNGGDGFEPLGTASQAFTGSFDGLGHTVSGLTINRPGMGYVGFFGIAEGQIRNVGLVSLSVKGLGAVGGLAGRNYGDISNSYVSGTVSGDSGIGGLVGQHYGGSISNSFAGGYVTGGRSVGGLVGRSENAGISISNSYATARVTGADPMAGGSLYVGGLVGENYLGSISTSFASGYVTGTGGYTGGLVGYNRDIVSQSYWNTTTSGQTSSSGGTGLTSDQMMRSANFAGWDTSTWKFYDGYSAPLLKSFLTPLTVTIASGSRVYDGTTATNLGVSYSATPNGNLLGRSNLVVSAASKNVGAQTLSASGLYSNQQGYDIDYVSGTLTIAAKAITGTITAADKHYDGTTAATTSGSLSGAIAGDAVRLASSGAFADKDVGPAKIVNVSGSLFGADAGNYTVTTNTTTTATITPPVPVVPPAPVASAASALRLPITTQLVSALLNNPGTLSTTAPSASQTLPGRLTVAADGTPAAAGSGASQAPDEASAQYGGASAPTDSAPLTLTAQAGGAIGLAATGMAFRVEGGGVKLPDELLRFY